MGRGERAAEEDGERRRMRRGERAAEEDGERRAEEEELKKAPGGE